MLRAFAAVAGFFIVACGPPTQQAAPCNGDGDCQLEAGGRCLASPLGSNACAYPDGSCPGGYHWGDLTGAIAGQCVESVDAGVDAPDASVDSPDAPIDGPPIACSGLRIAFDDGQGANRPDPYVAALDGSQRQPLAPAAGLDYAVTGSTAGTVAFASDRDGNLEIYRVNADGSGLINLTMNAAPDGNPVYSRGGAFLAFARSGALWTMTSAGASPQAVAAGNAYTPRWSPDDARLVFELWNGSVEADLWIVNRDGSGLRPLTSAAGTEAYASWSPDGSRIAFQAGRDIFIINADGTGQVNLTNDALEQYAPAWSPDGTRIAFAESGDIKTMGPAGGTRTPLSSGPGVDALPLWSPDGTKIAFARTDAAGTRRDLVVANADGSAPSVFSGPANYVNSYAWVVCP